MSLVFCAMWQAILVVPSIGFCCVLSLFSGLQISSSQTCIFFSRTLSSQVRSLLKRGSSSLITRSSTTYPRQTGTWPAIYPLPKPRRSANTRSRSSKRGSRKRAPTPHNHFTTQSNKPTTQKSLSTTNHPKQPDGFDNTKTPPLLLTVSFGLRSCSATLGQEPSLRWLLHFRPRPTPRGILPSQAPPGTYTSPIQLLQRPISTIACRIMRLIDTEIQAGHPDDWQRRQQGYPQQ